MSTTHQPWRYCNEPGSLTELAILYQKTLRGVTYEVRTAGASRRLYTNGAFHTQYHPAHIFTGAIWDLLSLPSLCLAHTPRNILVLGVAGGTVVHQLMQLHNVDHITGIEIDAEHIRLARAFFSLNYPELKLIKSDARSWLAGNTLRFDYIVDDVFLHTDTNADPARGDQLDHHWFKLLQRSLKPGGVLVQNHVARDQATLACSHLPNSTVLRFNSAGFENDVLAFYPKAQTAADLKQQLRDNLQTLPAGERRRLRHRVRKVNSTPRKKRV